MINLEHVNLRRMTTRGAVAFVGLLIAGVATALAQAPVDMRVRQVNPRVQTQLYREQAMDANPLLGGGGLNYRRPVSPLMTGNLAASGHLGRGFSLRIQSPIPSSSTFRAGLGSASLYGFRRDSVGVGSAGDYGTSGFLGQPYFDPARTVTSTGWLQGRSVPGLTSLPQRSLPSQEMRTDVWEQPQVGLRTPMPFGDTLPMATAEGTTSSIFGMEPPPSLVETWTQSQLYPWQRREGGDERGPQVSPWRLRPEGGLPDEELDEAGASPLDPLSTPLDEVLRAELYRGTGFVRPGETTTEVLRPGLRLPPYGEGGDELAGDAGGPGVLEPLAPQWSDPTALPGYDVFTDMQLALAAVNDPNAPWLDEMQQRLEERPELAEELKAQAAENAELFLQQMLETPLRTFTGGGDSAFNNQMLRAESLIEIGRYYEAVDRYEAAHMIDPANPLPLIGKGYALLAAGEYRSAAAAILQALERYPNITRFQIDLKTMLGGGEVVDMRRSDLLRLLRQHETPELRFLLGYLEYHTGDRERGLENLHKAAEHPKASMLMAQYPNLLKQTPRVPVPRSEAPLKVPPPAELDDGAERSQGEALIVPPLVPEESVEQAETKSE